MSTNAILLVAPLPIGDTIWTEPTVRALRRQYPQAWITALVHRLTQPIWRCMPDVSETLVLPTGRDWHEPGALLELLGTLRSRHFDAAVHFSSPAYKWISLAAHIPLRTYMKFDRLWWLLPRQHRRWQTTHAVQHYYDCARELDLPPLVPSETAPRLELPHANHVAATEWLRSADRPVVAIHPGGVGLNGLKRWPAECFAQLADRLHDACDATIILVGGPDEAELSATVAQPMRTQPIIATGAVPLLTSLALVAACDLFIGDDSSLLHAAAATGARFVGVFGPTDPDSFRPLGRYPDQGQVVVPEPACPEPVGFVGSSVVWQRPTCQGCCAALGRLPVEAVFSAARRQLLGSPRPTAASARR